MSTKTEEKENTNDSKLGPNKSEGKPIHNQTRDSSTLQHHMRIKLLQLKNHPQHQ